MKATSGRFAYRSAFVRAVPYMMDEEIPVVREDRIQLPQQGMSASIQSQPQNQNQNQNQSQSQTHRNTIAELNKVEELVVSGLLGTSTKLLKVLAQSFTDYEKEGEGMEVEEENQSQVQVDADARNKDFKQLAVLGAEYVTTLEEVTTTIMKHIPSLSPFTEIERTNYGIKKDLETMNEVETTLVSIIDQQLAETQDTSN